MASALRSTILGPIRVPISLNGARLMSVRSMSSSNDDKKEVIDGILEVLKSFPKVDPSKVTPPDVHLGSESVDVVMTLEEEFKLKIVDNKDSGGVTVEYTYNHPLVVQYIYKPFGG